MKAFKGCEWVAGLPDYARRDRNVHVAKPHDRQGANVRV